jgi:hypothetical protein
MGRGGAQDYRRGCSRWLLSAAGGLLFAGSAQADAQNQGPPEPAAEPASVIYPAEFYSTFQAQTALDMLLRTPGLVIDYGDAGGALRGFGSGAGNVLVDGQRPTVKSGGLAPVLRRIAAARVERIELLRGGQLGEAQGQSLVANVILRAAAKGSGNLAFELRRAPGDEVITPNAELSYTFTRGAWELSAGGTGYYEQNPFAGRYEWREGEALTVAAERFDENLLGGSLNGGAAGPLAGGTLNLNLQLELEDERYAQRLEPSAPDVATSGTDGRVRESAGEIGVDWTRGVGRNWSAKAVALLRTSTLDLSEVLEDGSLEQLEQLERLDQREKTREFVARGTIRRDGHAITPELTAELAWNSLDSQLRITNEGNPIELPGQSTSVSELRGELVGSVNARLVPNLRLETALAYERARITVTGDAVSSRSLSFWKPSSALVWDPVPSTSVRLGWKRTVGQLDFAAFAASGDLIDDRPIAGNAELRPDVTEAWSASLDHRFGTGGALTLKGEREWIADALAYVPLASGGEALINFGNVALWRVSGEATLPLDVFVRGAQLTVSGTAAWARRRDPVTADMRDDSRALTSGEVSFRHDVRAWRIAYGVSAEASTAEREWYVSEFSDERYRPYVSAFVESTALFPGFKTTLTIYGLLGEREWRNREFFFPDRRGAFTGSERRLRHRGSYVNLMLVRSF